MTDSTKGNEHSKVCEYKTNGLLTIGCSKCTPIWKKLIKLDEKKQELISQLV